MIKNSILEQEADRLKKNPYIVPQGYFEALPSQLHAAIEKLPSNVGKPKMSILRNVMRYAACFALLIGFGYGIVNILPHDNASSFDEEEALLASYSQISLYQLYESESDSDTQYLDSFSQIDQEELMGYLAYQGYDPTKYNSEDE